MMSVALLACLPRLGKQMDDRPIPPRRKPFTWWDRQRKKAYVIIPSRRQSLMCSYPFGVIFFTRFPFSLRDLPPFVCDLQPCLLSWCLFCSLCHWSWCPQCFLYCLPDVPTVFSITCSCVWSVLNITCPSPLFCHHINRDFCIWMCSLNETTTITSNLHHHHHHLPTSKLNKTKEEKRSRETWS